jgi:tetratricopeptide (TPR) repeat protein
LRFLCKSVLITGFTFLTAGCASKLSIASNPSEAEVDLVSQQDQVVGSLGTTPLLITPDTLAEKQSGGPYVLRISKDGYLSQEILLMSINGIQANLNLQLRTNEPSKALNETIDVLFYAQELAQNGEYQQGLDTLTNLQKIHPGIIAIYEIKGSIFMLRGDYQAAAHELEKATQLNPDNAALRKLYETALHNAGRPSTRTPAMIKKGQ